MATGGQWRTGVVSTVGDGTDLREKAVNLEEVDDKIIKQSSTVRRAPGPRGGGGEPLNGLSTG